jgi:hypothetical protein
MRLRRKKGAIIRASTQPVLARRVIGLDELGPVSAKTYPGEVWTCGPRRDSASFIQLLERVPRTYPAREWRLITDNLTTPLSPETQAALLAWPEMHLLLLPKYACWLNLIEPCWKQLRSLALKGRRFEGINEVIEAIVQATMYWNAHRHPYLWKKAA